VKIILFSEPVSVFICFHCDVCLSDNSSTIQDIIGKFLECNAVVRSCLFPTNKFINGREPAYQRWFDNVRPLLDTLGRATVLHLSDLSILW